MTTALETATQLIEPHGGTLIDRVAEDPAALIDDDASLPVIRLNARQESDARLIAQGAFSPLEGFLSSADYHSVRDGMRLASGVAWSLPVTLAVDEETAAGLREGSRAALAGPDGSLAGTIDVAELYGYDKRIEAERVFRTTDEAHPGVAGLYAQGPVLVGGTVTMLPGAPKLEPAAAPYHQTPAETRAALTARNWRTAVGFQTRNPVHRAHEYIQKCAMEITDGLLLHPLVGETKPDDIPAGIRMRCYEALLENYYPAGRVHLSVFPAFMRYAGPREAVFHALARKNYGCSHFIVGRDHAGVGAYYGTYDAQHIFREFEPRELGITPLYFENSFFCSACGAMASEKTCPHGADSRVSLSGTQVRDMLARRETPPPEFSRPEVARVLMEEYANP